MLEHHVKILLIEDNPDHAFLIAHRLTSKLDCEVVQAKDADEAFSKLEATEFDLIISDYNLPYKNGLDILREIKVKNVKAPFIMLTGAGDERIAVSAMQEGAYNYLVKDEQSFKVIHRIVDETLSRYELAKIKEKLETEIRIKNAQLEKANRELRKLDELKSEFIASVSHEFRTPLNSVKEVFALFSDGIVDQKSEKGKRALQIAAHSVERLTVLINDLLDFSKLEAGKMRLNKKACRPERIITETLEEMEALAQRSGISLHYNVPSGTPNIYADHERMVQVMTNLVGNAIKFTPKGGRVDISVKLTADRAVFFCVSDTGKGIPKKDLERIFKRFEQVKGPNGEKTVGTGLGLSICKEIIDLHQGNIWAESEIGKGSKFCFTLPAYGG